MEFYLYNNVSKTFHVVRPLTICGRMEGELRFPEDDLLSKRHCKFTVVGNEVYLEDFGSTNKTKVNSVEILSGRRRKLHLNDVIELGNQRLILTHQNSHPPGSLLQITAAAKRQYKALRRDDGSLTRAITGLITKQTFVGINRPQYVRLRMNRALRPVRKVNRNSPWAWLAMVLCLMGASVIAYSMGFLNMSF